MQNPSLTIAIPFYNNLEYLRNALNSVKSQTSSDWHCIVVDDCGPNPESEGLVNEYQDPRITYYRAPENGGLAINWNRCLDLALTDLVMIFHADDELKINYVESMLQVAKNYSDASGIFCNAEIINDQGENCFSFPDYVKEWIRPKTSADLILSGDQGLSSIMRGSFIMCPTLIYRKSKLKNFRFSSKWRMVLDLEMYSQILSHGGQLVGTKKVLYRYRRHTANQTSLLTSNTVRFNEEFAIYDEIKFLAAGLGWNRTEKIAGRKTIIKLNLLFQIVTSLFRLKLKDSGKFAMTLLEGFKF